MRVMTSKVIFIGVSRYLLILNSSDDLDFLLSLSYLSTQQQHRQQTQLSYFLPITLQNKDVVKNSFRVCDLRRSDGGHLDLLVWVWPEDEVDR